MEVHLLVSDDLHRRRYHPSHLASLHVQTCLNFQADGDQLQYHARNIEIAGGRWEYPSSPNMRESYHAIMRRKMQRELKQRGEVGERIQRPPPKKVNIIKPI